MIERLLALILCFSLSGCFILQDDIREEFLSRFPSVMPFEDGEPFVISGTEAISKWSKIGGIINSYNVGTLHYYNQTTYQVRKLGDRQAKEGEALPEKFITLQFFKLANDEYFAEATENESPDGKNIAASKKNRVSLFFCFLSDGSAKMHYSAIDMAAERQSERNFKDGLKDYILNPLLIFRGYDNGQGIKPVDYVTRRELYPLKSVQEIRRISSRLKNGNYEGARALPVKIRRVSY